MLAAKVHRAKSFISGQMGKADASPPLVPVMAAVRDMRPVDVVVNAAAASVGAQDNAAPAVKAIREHGVHWAFQLAQAGAEDWRMFGGAAADPVGLNLAIKAELQHSSVSAMDNEASKLTPEEQPTRAEQDVPDRLRTFLFLQDRRSRPPPRLFESSAFMLGLLTVPAADRQNLVIATCELIALASGLMLPLPLSFRRHRASAILGTGTSFAEAPGLDDSMDALVAFAMASLAICTWFALSIAIFVAAGAGGRNGSLHFYEPLTQIIAFTMFLFIFGGFWPLLTLLFWDMIMVSGSPYLALAALLLSLAFLLGLLTLNIKFFIREMPLELYHMPRWLLAMIRCQVPWLGSQLRDTALEPRAKRRAAELRQLAGLAPEVAV